MASHCHTCLELSQYRFFSVYKLDFPLRYSIDKALDLVGLLQADIVSDETLCKHCEVQVMEEVDIKIRNSVNLPIYLQALLKSG